MAKKKSTKSVTKKSATKKSATKKSATKKSATKKSATKKSATKKSATKKSATLSLVGGGRDAGRSATQADAWAAQDLVYDAWQAPSAREAVKLAREALSLDPDCADAYVLLAEASARTLEAATDYYRRGVEAGERALGAELFEDAVGDFWGVLETRPYMRAREGLARCLWMSGERDEAIGHYRELLRLNPSDNQGLRYVLLGHLLGLGRDDEARELWVQYEDDATAQWTYGAALLAYRAEGDSPVARERLGEARETNPHVPQLLLGDRALPEELPEYMSFGDESEAMFYAADNQRTWAATPGALPWLRANADERGREREEPARERGGAKLSSRELREMVQEATVDAHDDSEQRLGLYTMLEDELQLPFETEVLGVEVSVDEVELTEADEIVAVCRRGKIRQRISLLELPLPTPPPPGAEWIEAYRYWAK